MARRIVVAFRMSAAGMAPGPEGTYLTRARSLCVRGEALGGRLVAWSASQLAMSWSVESIEQAVLFATSIREEALSRERAWSSGMAEGEVEPLSTDGEGILAWGPALIAAISLADMAASGEVLIDGDVQALRSGELSLLGAEEAADGSRRVRGWRLDLEHPWNRGAAATGERPTTRPSMAIAPDVRCQASLAQAWALSMVGRAEEALLQTLDALARAREGGDPKATMACMALLAKLYAAAGRSDAALALRYESGCSTEASERTETRTFRTLEGSGRVG